MSKFSSKEIKELKKELSKIETGLNFTITGDKFEDFSHSAIFIAETLESEYAGSIARIQELREKGLACNKKKHYLLKIYEYLSPKVELVFQREERDNPSYRKDILHSYESKGFRNSSIERLEALKLQLSLASQKGFYSVCKDKGKVKAQEDILVISAQIIQELSYEDTLVQQILNLTKNLREFEDISYVTETEEAIISNCYVLLFEKLLDLDYR